MPLPPELAEIARTSSGAHGNNTRIFVLDISGGKLKSLPAETRPTLNVSGDHGKILNVNVQPNPLTGGWRASFELSPDNAKAVELRAQLMNGPVPLSETWIYRWTA